jgi:hypothetical protein
VVNLCTSSCASRTDARAPSRRSGHRSAGAGLGLGERVLELRSFARTTALPLEGDQRGSCRLARLAGRALLTLDLVDARAGTIACGHELGERLRRRRRGFGHGRSLRTLCPGGFTWVFTQPAH